MEDKLPPHVLIFPCPAQGHMNCMLNLAHLFCLADFHVTFIVSDFIHRRLLKHTSVSATFAAYPGFQFRSLTDGLPDDHPRSERSMDGLVKGIPGMEGFLRRRDLPGFFRADDVNDPLLQSLAAATTESVRAQALIFNTFQDLEGSIISLMQEKMPIIYTIGPIHEQLKSRLVEKKAEASAIAANFWAEDRSCINWLEMKKLRSVIYVSFGSITVLTREQFLEFWHGLVNSEHRFLWVMRPGSVSGNAGNDQIPVELVERSKGQCYLVEWAPQEEVLNHPAIGVFLTHNGWNSTLESIVAGVPMICWPYFGDQTVNSRFVSEVWGVGLDIKDTRDRLIIEEAIRDVMVVRKEVFLEKADHLAKLAKKAVSRGGSSYAHFDDLVEYIKSLITM